MHKQSSYTFRPDRRGFTLVELLITIGILLVLMTVTVTTLQYSAEKEKISNGARDAQSFLSGARDRAIFRRKPTGVRLVLDPFGPKNAAGNPICVSSMLYVGSPEPLTGQISIAFDQNPMPVNSDIHLRTLKFWSPGLDLLPGTANQDDDMGAPPPAPDGYVDNTSEFGQYFSGTGGPSDDVPLTALRNEFTRLYNMGLLSAGVQITFFPAGDSALRYTLVGQPGSWALSSDYPATNVSQCMNVDFEIQLRPAALPDSQVRQLPRGVVIDLEASRQNGTNVIPSLWYDSTNNKYRSYLDIIFSPRGVGYGQWTAAGQIHLVFADVEDVEKSYPGGIYTIGQRENIARERIITVNSNSGKASMTDLNYTNPSDLFKFGETGDILP